MKALTAVASILQAVGFSYVVLLGHHNSEALRKQIGQGKQTPWKTNNYESREAEEELQRRVAHGLSVVEAASITVNDASAFAIMSMILSFITLLLCVLLVCKRVPRSMIATVTVIVVTLTIVASWLCVVGVHHYDADRNHMINRTASISMRYSVFSGFSSVDLMVTAWVMQLVNVLLLMKV